MNSELIGPGVSLFTGDCLEVLRTFPADSVHCCVTSPPYWGLRDYGVAGQLGLEATPQEYVDKMVSVFAEVRRVLRPDGTLWLNLGDSYAATGKSGGGDQGKRWEDHGADYTGPRGGKWRPAPEGLKPKDLVGIPWRVAFALQADGWYLRQDIIWHKPNPMPESVRDRCTKAHEYLFLLTKSERYFFDSDAIKEPANPAYAYRYKHAFGGSKAGKLTAEEAQGAGSRTHPIGNREFSGFRNCRSVWLVPTANCKEAHFATFPPKLIEPCIKAGAPTGGTVLDPFGGSGTTGKVALELGRKAVLIELNPTYGEIIKTRCGNIEKAQIVQA